MPETNDEGKKWIGCLIAVIAIAALSLIGAGIYLSYLSSAVPK